MHNRTNVLSTPHSFVQFHPICYLIKLNIEMNMADLIAKIAKASRERLGIAAIHTSQVRMTPRLTKDSFDLRFSRGTSTTSDAWSSHHRATEAAATTAAAVVMESPLKSNPAPFENNLKDVQLTNVGRLLVSSDDARRSTGIGEMVEAGEAGGKGEERQEGESRQDQRW